MRKLYIIAYDESLRRDALTQFLASVPDTGPWFYSIPNSVFVFSSLSAVDLYGQVHRRFGGHGRFFVSEAPYRNIEGWIPNNHWDLIKQNSTVHNYTLDFRGYWLDKNKHALPAESGVYCVYAATYNQNLDTVLLQNVLYIGKAVDVRARHMNHEGKPSWERQLKAGQVLCYSFASLASRSLVICESALIYKHKPVCNDLGKESFLHEATHVVTKGRNALLVADFTVFQN